MVGVGWYVWVVEFTICAEPSKQQSMIGVTAEVGHDRDDLLMLALLAVAAGAGTGFIVTVFRLILASANRWRNEAIVQAYHLHFGGFLLVVAGCTAAVAAAAWLVRRFSTYASGSGVPEVEAALAGTLPPAPLWQILFIKFAGGLLSIGSGMALGPEGPGVQMGAVSARLIGTAFRRAWPDVQALVAAGAGAGIAVAFNAPIAGAIFVLEELVRRFEMRIAIAGLGASSTAILVSRMFLGNAPDLHVAVSGHVMTATGPLLLCRRSDVAALHRTRCLSRHNGRALQPVDNRRANDRG